MANIKVSVITVTYNNEKNIGKYLNSLFDNLPDSTEVIIVDNNSADKTVDKIKTKEEVKLIKNDHNLGFAKANNQAAGEASGEYLFFLNPDTEVKSGSIEKLLKFLERNKEVGIVAPKLMQPDGKIQPSVRKLPTIWGAVKEYYLGIKNSYEAYIPRGEDPVEVESVVGGAMLIQKDLFLKLGGFSEKYFMYFEDLELCKKVKAFGFKVYYLPEVKIIHQVGASISPNKLKWIKQSQKIYFGEKSSFVLDLIFRIRQVFNKIF